jgi:type I restriction enzyme S subunit
MSFPRYPKYKPSGVEWLGDVPEHWSVLPCRAIVQERAAKNDDARCQDYLSLMANVGVIPYAEKGDIGNKKPEDLSKCKIVTRGDFVINSMNYGIGSYGLSDYDGVCSSVYIVLKPKNDVVESRFAFRIFECRSFQKFSQSFGNGILEHRSAINWDILKSIGVGIPTFEEQHSILEFLDRETLKIDELVAEQRRLMELLKEKRQTVISHAVTKGLKPHAPMKPSGIEWLGDVPEHWGVWKLTHAFEKIGSGTTPKTDNREYYDDGTHPWVNTGDLNDGDLTDCEKKITDLALSDHTTLRIYPAGSVVIAMYGATIGKLAILRFPASVNQACCVFSGRLTIEYKFLFFWLLAYRPQIISLASGGGQPNVNQDILRGLRVACPALAEQITIIDFLEAETAKFDTLTAEAQRAIDLLQERRTALISAAVTGQIDVRNSLRN